MASVFRPAAASTARRAGRRLRSAVAVASIAVLSLTSSAILAGRPAILLPVAIAATRAPELGSLTGTAVPETTPSDDAGSPVATDLPPIHGAPPPGCPLDVPHPPFAKVVHHGSRTTKVVALTFDDGWVAPNVLAILAILQNGKVNATFFPTGQAMKHEPVAWKAVALAGYPIGNHTFDHPHLQGMCWNGQLAELVRQDAVVAGELGLAAIPYMRPPFGDYDDATRLAAAEDGEQAVVLWDVDTEDWAGLGPRAITARAMAGTNGSIIVMHTMEPNTVKALPTIIAKYRARGFTFVTVGQLLGIDGPTPFE
jgi:peptidoglycan/xylan/chitin deacetylase (PgdA/CDA1 family)